MATRSWQGHTVAVARVLTITPTAANGTVYTLGTGDGLTKTATYTSDGSATVAEITAGLVAAWNASTAAELAEITAADITTAFTLTADTAGKYFSITSVGAGTLSPATTTESQGPEDSTSANNWAGTPPADADDLIVENSAVAMKYRLDQSTIELTSLTIRKSMTGDSGLEVENDDAGTTRATQAYREYRDTYWKIDATTATFGRGDGSGGRIKHWSTVTTTWNIWDTGTTKWDTDNHPCIIKGDDASNVLNMFGGSVDVAPYAGDTAALATITKSAGTLRLGPGVTLTTVNQADGDITIQSAATTVNQNGGTSTVNGAGAITSLNINVGTCSHNGTGTVTTLRLEDGTDIDFGGGNGAITVTNCTVTGTVIIRDPKGRVTFTNPITVRGNLSGLTLDRARASGTDQTLAIA